jgi:proline dehydrogenase
MVEERALEQELFAVGEKLAAALPRSRNPLKAADDKAMELASQDAELKAALFRFVDVVPACRSLDDLARHLTGFLGEVGEPPPPISAAMRMGANRAGRTALGAAAARGVKHMAHRFIVGESPRAALGVFRDLWKHGVASSVDLLGEATVTQAEAQRYAQRCDEALDTLVHAMADWPDRPHLERDAFGPLPRANLSVKVSALTPLLRADAPERGQRDAAQRLRGLLRRAAELGAHLHIDMESLDSRDAVLELILALLAEDEFQAGPSAGVVLQAYLRDSPQTLDTIVDWIAGAGAGRAHPLTVRLVKGAYWDHEIVEAKQHGWQPPVFEVKADSDLNFEVLTRGLIDHRRDGCGLRPAIASHNLRSVAHAIAYNRLAGGDDADVELQILRGLGDPLQTAIAAQGLRVRAYCPVGDLVAGMAYLVRRLLENTSNDSFLQEQARGVPVEELLAKPLPRPAAASPATPHPAA